LTIAMRGHFPVKKFKVAAIQFDVHRGDLKWNLSAVKRRILPLAQKGVKLVVLPEMWSIGFANKRLQALSATTPGVLDDLCELAGKLKVVIVGSLPERKGTRIYNTAYAIDVDGSISGTYRKVHLFSPTGEDKYFEGGRKAVIAPTSLGPMGLMICYDLRFPELSRCLVLGGASMVAVMAQWPAERVGVWKALLKARAMENQLFVIGANRCGADGAMGFGGHSQILSPDGEILARAGKRPNSLTATIDLRAIERVRKRIPCLKERVPEAYRC
jgi:predicted amidohydrolase